jgi:hypothetical protein
VHTNTEYKPGDVANGHVLTAQGTWEPAPAVTPKKKHLGLKITGGIVAGIVVLGIIGAVTGSGETRAPSATPNSRATTSDKPPPKAAAPAEQAAPAGQTEPQGTVSQMEALESAQSYLEMSGFSKAGLMDQLTSDYGDGFSKTDAAWAIAHLHADWKAEAVEAGRAYLDQQSFSRKGLIDQLSSSYGDQFTRAQATYAADKLGL